MLAVISGKGGVGKSTVAVNLALALAEEGYKTALVDCDFYGPSIPTMLGGGELQVDHEKRIIPPKKWGVKYISIGFFLNNRDEAVIWRGPMFNKAMLQMFSDVNWGNVDYFVVDMPPGTGDAQLSLAQNFPVTGALVVTTPQEVAVSDVRKAVNMLRKVNIPLIGVVENMAGFIDSMGNVIDIFGKGGGEAVAEFSNSPLLVSIPLSVKIREGGDKGEPVFVGSGEKERGIFKELAEKVIQRVNLITNPDVDIVNE